MPVARTALVTSFGGHEVDAVTQLLQSVQPPRPERVPAEPAAQPTAVTNAADRSSLIAAADGAGGCEPGEA